jgi:hypothetical protein
MTMSYLIDYVHGVALSAAPPSPCFRIVGALALQRFRGQERMHPPMAG